MWNKYVQMQHVCMHVPAAFLHGISCGACADVHSCRNKHPLWNMYKSPLTVLIFPVWINDDTSVFSYGVTAFASQWRTTQGPPFRNPGSIRQGQQEAPPPHSTCSFQCWVSLPCLRWNVWPAETWWNESLQGPPVDQQLLSTYIMSDECARTEKRHFCTFLF